MEYLAHFNRAKRELALATKIDEVKEIRDRAEALRVYAKQAGEGLIMQNQCAEMKIRAERRGGELLGEQEKHKGAATPSHDKRALFLPKLKDLGIDHNQSHRWQQIASVPEEKFEEHIVVTKEQGKELTSIGLLNLVKQLRRGKTKEIPLPRGKFNIIYADPPWQYIFSFYSRAIESQYETWTLEDICDLEIPAADDAVLFLWVPVPKKIEGLRVVKAWGFEYKTGMVWVKDKIGMGYYVRGQHELLFIASKGNLPVPLPENRPSSVIDARREKHSRKPKEVYKKIEQMYPDGKYLELFATEERPNWVSWGDQVG